MIFSQQSRPAPAQPTKKVEKLEVPLKVSLEDIYNGVTKRMKISRSRRQANGVYRQEDKILTIDVKKGWKEGTKITFNSEGDEKPNHSAGDVVFVLKVYNIFFFISFYIFIRTFRQKYTVKI